MTARPRNVIVTGLPRRIGVLACDMPYLVFFEASVLATSHALVDVYSIGYSGSRHKLLSAPERRALLLAYCRADRSLCRQMLRDLEYRSALRQRWAQGWRRAWFGNIRPLLWRVRIVRPNC